MNKKGNIRESLGLVVSSDIAERKKIIWRTDDLITKTGHTQLEIQRR